MGRLFFIICATIAMGVSLQAEKLQKWVYIQTNLLPEDSAAQVEQLIVRAGKAGYDHAVLADSKFSRLSDMPEKYFKHIAHLREVAAGAHVEIVPAVFSMGYSNDLLSRNPNLAEGLPVKDAPFIVSDGEARAVTEAPAAVLNGDFGKTGKRNGWKLLDHCVKLEDGALHMLEPQGGNARAMQPLKLQPF